MKISTDPISMKAALLGQELNNNDFMFVSQGRWYDKGSICWLDANCGNTGGIFVGQRNGKLDGELCGWDEFDIYFQNDLVLEATDKP